MEETDCSKICDPNIFMYFMNFIVVTIDSYEQTDIFN